MTGYAKTRQDLTDFVENLKTVSLFDSVNSPAHYMHGKKETIDVIRDCMEGDEYHGYLKGNVLKYVSRYKFKGEPLQDLEKAQWYLNRLVKEVKHGKS